MTGEAGESNGFAEAGKKSLLSQRGGKSAGVFADKNKTERKKISPVIEPLLRFEHIKQEDLGRQ
jgi:hypothetical protein